MESHAEFLRLAAVDEELARAIRADWRTAPVDARDRAMLAHAHKLTVDAQACTPGDLDALRAHAFDDQAILQITLIASFFNYVNRVADGLGVGRGPRPAPGAEG